jgi:hypothetical protein
LHSFTSLHECGRGCQTSRCIAVHAHNDTASAAPKSETPVESPSVLFSRVRRMSRAPIYRDSARAMNLLSVPQKLA